MKTMVISKFNDQQLIIAKNVKHLIENNLIFLTSELSSFTQTVAYEDMVRIKLGDTTHQSLSRVFKNGVDKVKIIDLIKKQTFIITLNGLWTDEYNSSNPPLESLADTDRTFFSNPTINTSGIHMILGVTALHDSTKLIVFNINLSWFLKPFMKDIRSGKTGYAWIVDKSGTFLFHPNTNFIGENAFIVREKEHPETSYVQINFIQKNKMLKGMEGMGSYEAFWHRGITGKIQKLIAYCPVNISENPPQKWSVAIVAPVSEIEDDIDNINERQFMIQGFVIAVIIMTALAVLLFEIRWSIILKQKVDEKTESLIKSEEKYRSLVESAEDFIFTIDSEGNFQSMNSFTANFFGGRPEEFLHTNLSSIFSKKSAARQLDILRLVYKHGKTVRDEFQFQVGNHEIWISANFMPLKNEEGNVISVLCIARDITESKNLERQLVNTEKLASLGTLAAGVAHEINNPLGVILGFCDLLIRNKKEGSQEYEDLKTIERQGLQCKQIVENLLSFARLGEGHSEYSDLNQCIHEITNIVQHMLEMNNIQLVLDFQKDIPPVRGDSRQLQQVFLNLANNAYAAVKNHGEITIRTHYEQSTGKAIVKFMDNGIGIKKEDMEHIFEPFFTTKPEGEGTGLGLSVSYGIIAKYGGAIDCTSTPADPAGPANKSTGTTFTVKLLTGTKEK